MKPNPRRSVLPLLGVIAFGLVFHLPVAAESPEPGHDALPHSHVAVFLGAGFEQPDSGENENAAAFGVEYEYQFQEHWGIGLDVERLFAGQTERSWVSVAPVSFHATESWRLFAGPGFE